MRSFPRKEEELINNNKTSQILIYDGDL
uniref:Uncharacterized protein n=1 Tax=Lepeophtheirus salmonis TaxID=72036 RepID=A0A0K2VEA2_LEPSM